MIMLASRQMIEEVVPVRDVVVRVAVPEGKQVTRVYRAPDEQGIPFSLEEGYVVIPVDKVHLHAMIVLDLVDSKPGSR
jgi:hypothetical protein